jgi:photosystem II stability/assembly factor-like uncharacterized protein
LVNSLDVAIGAPTDYPTSVYFVNAQVGWIVNSNGYVGKSVDGGRTWSDISRELDSTKDLSIRRWNMQVYFSDPATGWAIDGEGRLLQTEDGGVDWRIVDDKNRFSAFYFLDGQHGWAVTNYDLFRITPARVE